MDDFWLFLPIENHLSVTLFNKVKETVRQHREGEFSDCKHCFKIVRLPQRLSGKESGCDAGDVGSSPGWERSPGGGQGNPLQCSCLENPMDRGAWQAPLYRVVKSRTQLKRLGPHTQYPRHTQLAPRCLQREGCSSSMSP